MWEMTQRLKNVVLFPALLLTRISNPGCFCTLSENESPVSRTVWIIGIFSPSHSFFKYLRNENAVSLLLSDVLTQLSQIDQ